ncbi:hypothetical protein LEP1GSC060_0533 [Leptospira weilii serovar Ranarum str. ICFT]|uniref:Uncharacterized protein n=1 Tax=Leptospira weilii serovar Ranarum str. ICFT TaxID=1218598 RepID=N1WS69_9LEPT|nr:hypothetical protein [Leptospira weilii]EMY78688.1 hypothetical protein LEP1GSC060_0533 [Leptospira weilii serovar Ranarum str. ICFT]
MNKRYGQLLNFVLLAIFLAASSISSSQTDVSISVFWEKFRNAILKNDPVNIANLSRFPIYMPYGASEIKSKAELLKRYDEIFNGEADAKECFRNAKPTLDPDRKKEFTVSCKMKGAEPGAEEPILFGFKHTRAAGWKFIYLDNINE